MESHRKGEKVEQVFGCSECDKAFTREEHLKRHAKSHTDEPVHTCEVIGCSKSYTRKERLTRHYKVIRSRFEITFPCLFYFLQQPFYLVSIINCSSSVSLTHNFCLFQVSHLGQEPDRPFWCSECGKDFQRKEHLNRHQRNIHGVRNQLYLVD